MHCGVTDSPTDIRCTQTDRQDGHAVTHAPDGRACMLRLHTASIRSAPSARSPLVTAAECPMPHIVLQEHPAKAKTFSAVPPTSGPRLRRKLQLPFAKKRTTRCDCGGVCRRYDQLRTQRGGGGGGGAHTTTGGGVDSWGSGNGFGPRTPAHLWACAMGTHCARANVDA